MNSGWFPDYCGNFLDLKERGSITQPCSFDFFQTFQPTQMNNNEENKFYNIQLAQNMRNQSIYSYGHRDLMDINARNNNGYNHLPGSYFYAVSK